MTQFAAGIAAPPNPRAAYVDGLIALNRATNPVPAEFLQRRERDRLTVAEINQMDEQAIAQGLRAPSVHDTRTATERFLDILDLPRNAIANIAFGEPDVPTIAGGVGSAASWGALFGGTAGSFLGPAGTLAGAAGGAVVAGAGAAGAYGLAAVARPFLTSEADRRKIVARARQGTFGAPQVYTSDLLERLGVENNVARAVLGFAGDVLIDPTTYLSGGGNVVAKVGRDGTKAVFEKGGARMASQIVRHVQRTGTLPVDPQLSRLNHLFETTIKIGDEMHQVSGTAADLGVYRNAIAEGLAKLQNKALPAEEAAAIADDLNLARRRLKETFDRELVDLITTDPTIGPVERFRGQIARDFARDFAARSSHQATIPFSSLVVDRLPGYRSGNLPFGGFGEPGRLHRFLRATEDEFVGAREAGYTKAVEELKAASRTFTRGVRLSIAGHALPQMDDALRAASVTDADGTIHLPLRAIEDPEQVERMVREGWSINRPEVPLHHWAAVRRELDRVDHVRRESKRVALTDKVRSLVARERAASEAFDEARYQVDVSAALAPDSTIQKAQDELRAVHVERLRAEEQLADVSAPPRLEIEHSLDSMNASFREGDAAFSTAGPYSAVRRAAEMLSGRRPQRYGELEMRRANIVDAGAFAERLLGVENQRLASRLAARARFAGEDAAKAQAAEALSIRVAAKHAAGSIESLRDYERGLPQVAEPRPVLNIPKGTSKEAAKAIREDHRQAVAEWKANNHLSTTIDLPLEPIPAYVTSSDRPVTPPRVNERRVMAGRDGSQTPLLRAVAAAWGVLVGDRPDVWFDRADAAGGDLLAQTASRMASAAAAPDYEGFVRQVGTELVMQTAVSHRRRFLEVATALGIPKGNKRKMAEGLGDWLAKLAASGAEPATGRASIDATLRRMMGSIGTAWQELDRAGLASAAQRDGFLRLHGDPRSLAGGSMARTTAAMRRSGYDAGHAVVRHEVRIPEGRESAINQPSPLFGSPDIPKGKDGRVSNKGRSTSFDIQFSNDIDRALYEVGRPLSASDTEGNARRVVARDYLRRQLGITSRQARTRGRALVADIERQVFGFSPTLEAAVRRASPAGDRRVYLHDGHLVTADELAAAGAKTSDAELLPQLLTPDDYVTLRPTQVKAPTTTSGLARGTFGRAVGHMAGDRHFVLDTSRWARQRIDAANGLRFDYKASQGGTLLPWDMTARSKSNLDYMRRIAEETADQARFAEADAESIAELAQTVEKGRAAAEESARSTAALLAPIKAELRAIEESTPFRWLQSMNETMRRTRTAFSLNSERQMRKLARRYHFESVEQARIAKARAVNHINKSVAAGVKATGVEPAAYKRALTNRVFEIAVAQDERGVVGPLRDDIQRLMTDHEAAFATLRSDPEFEAVAQQIWRTHNDWQQIETGLGLLPDDLPRLAYLPIGFTEGARASHVDSLNRLGEAIPAGASGRLSTNPRFGLRRATNRMLWGPENEELLLKLATRPERGTLSPAIRELLARAHVDRSHWIWSGELNAHKANDETWAFERWRRDFLRRQRNAGNDLMTAGDRHLMGLPGGDASVAPWMPEEFPTSPQMLNHMRDDFFSSGAGILAETIFEEDIVTNFARRMGQHLEARASARFAEEVAPFIKLRTRGEVDAMRRGASKGTVLIDGIDYRPVKRELISKMRLKFPISEDVIDHYYWPVALADDIEDMARKLSSDADLTGAFRGIQVVQNYWKALQLFASPAWWTSNMVSGAMMSWLIGGSRPSRWGALAPLAMSIVNDIKRGGTKIDRKLFDLKGTSITGRDLKEMLVLGGVASAGRSLMEIPNILRTGADSSGMLGRMLRGGTLGKYYGKWFEFNAATDDLWRVMTALDLIEQGHSLDHAVDMARRAHVDFSDVSHAEQKWGTLVWPFYRWCVPDDCECLTAAGWKKVDEMRVGDAVISYNVEDDALEMDVAKGIGVFPYEGDMVRLHSKLRDFQFTPEHRCVVQSGHTGLRKIVRADELRGGMLIPKTAPFAWPEQSVLSPRDAAILGWIVTDGYMRLRGRGRNAGDQPDAMIYQSPQKHLDAIRELVGEHASGESTHPDTGVVCVRIGAAYMHSTILPVYRSKDDLPGLICRLSREAAVAMHKAMMDAEGSFHVRAGTKFTQKRGPVLDAFQILSSLLGMSANVTGSDRLCSIYIGNQRHFHLDNLTRDTVAYKGRVWCPETNNGTWVMRRNGQVMVTGNCKGNMSLQIRHFLDNPSYGAAFPKIRHAIDEAIQSEDELPVEMQPRWLRDNIAVQIGSNPSMRFALLKTLTPAQELFEAGAATMGGDGFFEFLKYVTSSANPLLKALPEIATQKEIYSGRPLGNDVPGGIPWADYLLNQLGPWRRGASWHDRIAQGVNDWPAEIARISLGGSRVHITSPDAVARQFEFASMEAGDNLRSRIKSARRRGDAEEAARLSGEMVDHYRRIWSLGYVDWVPRQLRNRYREEDARRRTIAADLGD